MGDTIHTYLYSNDINGAKQVFIPNVGCKLYLIPRAELTLIEEDKEEFQRPALYILLYQEGRKAYIGETTNFYNRIKQHDSKKDFWRVAVMFISQDNQLSDTEVKYLEAKAIALAKEMRSYDLTENCVQPKVPSLPRYKKDSLDIFFERVKFYLTFIGLHIFEPRVKKKTGVAPKYVLNGSKPMSGNKFARAIVEVYISKHPNITYKKLKEVFPRSIMKGEAGDTLSTRDEAIKNHTPAMADKLFLKASNKPLQLLDGTEVYVNTQTDLDIIERYITIAEDNGCTYDVVFK